MMTAVFPPVKSLNYTVPLPSPAPVGLKGPEGRKFLSSEKRRALMSQSRPWGSCFFCKLAVRGSSLRIFPSAPHLMMVEHKRAPPCLQPPPWSEYSTAITLISNLIWGAIFYLAICCLVWDSLFYKRDFKGERTWKRAKVGGQDVEEWEKRGQRGRNPSQLLFNTMTISENGLSVKTGKKKKNKVILTKAGHKEERRELHREA